MEEVKLELYLHAISNMTKREESKFCEAVEANDLDMLRVSIAPERWEAIRASVAVKKRELLAS